MEPAGEYVAFISYASENRDKAEQICASLETRGLPCWIAPRDVRAGREYADEILLGIEQSPAFILVLSAAANTSVFVSREVERAVAKAKPLFPIRIEEVTPTSGLELLVSGDQWTDVWSGRWDDHMNRLAHDLSDRVRGTADSARAAERHSLSKRRPVGVYAGVALLLVLTGVAIWSFSAEAPSRNLEAPVVVDRPHSSGDRPAEPQQGPVQRPTDATNPSLPPRTTVPPDTRATRNRDASPTAESRQASGSPTRGVQRASELSDLRETYDTISIRGSAIDDTLNQLWEEMRPAAPRVDMVTHQRSLRTSLTRTRDALAANDADRARKHLDTARADLAVLEQFLNR
jgi:hypothetical protein